MNGDAGDEEPGRGERGGWFSAQRWERYYASGERRVNDLAQRFPRMNRIVLFCLATGTYDTCLILAAQALLLMVPLLVVASAFLPSAARGHIADAVRSALGANGASADEFNAMLATAQSATKNAFGIVGLVLAMAYATTLIRRLQRFFEQLWDLPAKPLVSSALRSMMWIAAMLVAVAVQGPLRDDWGVAGWILSVALTLVMWWWTPHLLLHGRVAWRRLVPTALIVGGGVAACSLATRLGMGWVLNRSLHEYGPMGLIFSCMSLLVLGTAVIIFGAGIARVLSGPEAD